MTIERWNIGPEFDEYLHKRLGAALKAVGFGLDSEWSGVCGSQDVSHWTVSSEMGELTVESETYIGLSVTGPKALLDRVRKEFEAKATSNSQFDTDASGAGQPGR
jgi:hypothetical protein